MRVIKDLVKLAKENSWFRQEVITGDHSQVVLMSLKPGEEIGEEVHEVDQILFFVEGKGEAIIDGSSSTVDPGYSVFVPAGTKHNFRNSGEGDLKLYTVYAPPEHEPGVIHKTKQEAEESEHH